MRGPILLVLGALALAGALLVSAFGAVPSPHAAGPPPAGLTLPCKVVEVYDGDTITVEVTLTARVRLLDCWAPEIRTTDPDEKRRGLASRDHLRTIAEGQAAVLHVPADGARRMDDLTTMGRVLGRVWVGDRDLSREQVRTQHATATKTAPAP